MTGCAGRAHPVSEARPDHKLPEVRMRDRAGHDARFELAVSESLVWFAGHFPGHPVLPGVAQIGWAIFFAREAFGFPADAFRIERAKFRNPLHPGTIVNLELRRDPERPERVEWQFGRDDIVFSRGRLEFMAAP